MAVSAVLRSKLCDVSVQPLLVRKVEPMRTALVDHEPGAGDESGGGPAGQIERSRDILVAVNDERRQIEV